MWTPIVDTLHRDRLTTVERSVDLVGDLIGADAVVAGATKAAFDLDLALGMIEAAGVAGKITTPGYSGDLKVPLKRSRR
jgi:hypothetical protein